MPPNRPTITELEHLYCILTPDDRDQLLQELLVAVHQGAGAMAGVVDVWLLDHAARELVAEHSAPQGDHRRERNPGEPPGGLRPAGTF